MNFSVLLCLTLSCSLILAQSDIHNPETGKTTEKASCFPLCELLKELSAMKEKLGIMETRLTESESQILVMKEKEKNRVAFSAATGGGNKAIGPFSSATTLIFRKVFTNIGNTYNTDTGVFTAPVNGTYFFTLFHHAGGTHTASLSLIKNNEAVVMTYDHPSTQDTADNGGNAVILQLQQGDHVNVRLDANAHVWGNDVITTFSGFLLSQD
ncbi:cerebellin-1-like [Xyrichtys novacula]|uniref:Cerebellin-1-like n=1 Tax=Xyrichtys novacula TaxID=13765 RepID=A0AAV1HJ30_XYRNO|nr:cerebellin-1-like [Xyrichtys novacula]